LVEEFGCINFDACTKLLADAEQLGGLAKLAEQLGVERIPGSRLVSSSTPGELQ
jgi:hypothetical protein